MDTTIRISNLFEYTGQPNTGSKEFAVSLPDDRFEKVMKEAASDKIILISLFCVQNFAYPCVYAAICF